MEILDRLKNGWIQLLGVVSSLLLLVFWLMEIENTFKVEARMVDLVIGVLPAIVSLFTSFFQRYWIVFVVGLWFVFAGTIVNIGKVGVLFLLFSLILVLLPFLKMIFVRKT